MTLTPIKTFAVIALVLILAGTGYALTTSGSPFAIPPEVAHHPWFVATLVDTYLAFIWFWLWTAYVAKGWGERIVWAVLIAALGNIVMAIYVLIRLARLPAGSTVADFLTRKV